jgi:hypothetical protein
MVRTHHTRNLESSGAQLRNHGSRLAMPQMSSQFTAKQ